MNVLGLFQTRAEPAPQPTVIQRIIRKYTPPKDKSDKLAKTNTRGFDAASETNALADWFAPSVSVNGLLSSQLPMMRARCRERMRNDDYAKGFARQFAEAVVGATGVRIQALVRDAQGQSDDLAVEAIEKGWNTWAKKKTHVDMSGRNNLRDMLYMAMRFYTADGEVFIRKVTGPQAGEFGFALQVIDPDLCDAKLNQKAKNGNDIVLGVEVDEWYRPVAYHFAVADKSPNGWITEGGKTYVRIDASEIIHFFATEFPNQVRGIPPMAVSITRMRMLGGYEHAALINARAGAAKMGFYYRSGEGQDPATAEMNGELVDEVSPGTFTMLPDGYRVDKFDSEYPNGEIAIFKKTILRAIATGLGVDYPSLGNDLEAVNLSSARVAINETRQQWMGVQQTVIDNIVIPIYEAWLEQALIRKKLLVMGKPLMITSIDRYLDVRWLPRRWAWPDPKRDADQATTMINNRLKAPSSVASELGIDFEQEILQIAKDEAALEKLGLQRIPNTIPPDAYIADNYELDANGKIIDNGENG